jgi:hypothetical protein
MTVAMLLAGVLRPKVSDAKLQNLISDRYKGEGRPGQIGTGSTADAIRNESTTGRPTKGVLHSQKGAEYIRALTNWLRRNPTAAPKDIEAAQTVLDALKK